MRINSFEEAGRGRSYRKVQKLTQMSIKISKISYLSFTFKLNEKNVPLKIWFGDGLQKTFYWRGVSKFKRGCALRLVETFWQVETFVSECLNFN